MTVIASGTYCVAHIYPLFLAWTSQHGHTIVVAELFQVCIYRYNQGYTPSLARKLGVMTNLLVAAKCVNNLYELSEQTVLVN